MKPPKSRVKPHLFVPDPDVPGCCGRCHLPGVPGDAHHTLPAAGPEQAEHARRYGHEDGGEG